MSEQPTQPEKKQAAPVPLRALVINLLFSMFISLVIFAVASYYFLVPQIVHQSAELEVVKAQLEALTPAPEGEEEDGEEAAAPAAAPAADGAAAAAAAPAADGAPAAAPAAKPAAEPAAAQPAAATP
jgi:hypothetical protein